MWHWLAPLFRDSLAPRLKTDGAFLSLPGEGRRVLVPSLDGAALLKQGLAGDFIWQRGQLHALVSLEVLIAGDRAEDLARCLEILPSSEEGRALIGLAARGADRSLAYLLFLAYGKLGAARRRLEEGRSTPSDLAAAAKALMLLFGEEEEARQLLTRAEATCATPEELITCGEAYAAALGDQTALLRCLGAAEALRRKEEDPVRHAQGALLLARAWRTLCDNDEAARSDLEEASSDTSESAVLRECAAAWRLLFPEEPEAALRCLTAAEASVKWAADLTGCAALRVDVFGEDAQSAVGRCIGSAEAQAGSTQDWLMIAALWQGHMGDSAQAERCLRAAEGLCRGGEDLLDVARAWRAVLGNSAEEQRLRLSELDGRAGLDLMVRARGWLQIFEDRDEPRRRMKEVERSFLSRAEWESAARIWKEVFSDEDEAARCAAEADRYAQLESALNEGDWLACARLLMALVPDPTEARQRFSALMAGRETLRDLLNFASAWKEVFSDEAEARRLFSQAEGVAAAAVSIAPRIALAAAYLSVLGDADAGRRLLAQAEADMTEGDDLLLLAAAWEKDFGDAREAERCRLAELDLRAGDDLALRARGWRQIFSDKEEAERRLKHAEAEAVSAADFRRISAVWREVMENEAEAERCQAEADRLHRLDAALEAGNWLTCARIWLEVLGGSSDSQERFRSLEARARTVQDYVAFAEGWKLVFDREEDARRCMKEAESRVRFRSDWKVCAEGWRQIGDFMEAERCSR